MLFLIIMIMNEWAYYGHKYLRNSNKLHVSSLRENQIKVHETTFIVHFLKHGINGAFCQF